MRAVTRLIQADCPDLIGAQFKEEGFLNGYLACFGAGRDLGVCPANLAIIEQIVLARNRVQHGTDIGI